MGWPHKEKRPRAWLRGAVGPDIPAAVSRSIVLDVKTRVQMQAIGLGEAVNYLTGADVAGGGQPAPPNQTTQYPGSWAFWKERAMRR